ncbi:hypothetical protein NUSPORA_00002 [Nucleospora cyclopteri]
MVLNFILLVFSYVDIFFYLNQNKKMSCSEDFNNCSFSKINFKPIKNIEINYKNKAIVGLTVHYCNVFAHNNIFTMEVCTFCVNRLLSFIKVKKFESGKNIIEEYKFLLIDGEIYYRTIYHKSVIHILAISTLKSPGILSLYLRPGKDSQPFIEFNLLPHGFPYFVYKFRTTRWKILAKDFIAQRPPRNSLVKFLSTLIVCFIIFTLSYCLLYLFYEICITKKWKISIL